MSSLLKLNQDEVNRPKTSIKIEKVIKNLVNKKVRQIQYRILPDLPRSNINIPQNFHKI